MKHLLPMLALAAAALCPPARAEGEMQPWGAAVTWDGSSLLADGRRVCPVMGEIHYSRIPADEWRRELHRMRQGGVTVVATYVFWNHVEEQRGVFRWDGQRDLRRFLELCREEGLPVVLRMGPWCHGEVRNGGLPDWLFGEGGGTPQGSGLKAARLRTEDREFLALTSRLYRQIFAQVQGLQWKDGGPVLAAQFDNEYRGPASYLLALKRIATECGFDLPFYTRTGWPDLATPLPFGELLPLYGDYADGFWDASTREGVGSYYKAFNFRRQVQPATDMGDPSARNLAAPDGKAAAQTGEGEPLGQQGLYPYFTCELGGGMATAYHRRPYLYPEDAYAMALVKLGSGSNLLGYYMYHGGTNPEGVLGHLNECLTSPFTANNDLPVCTYDFQAPLGEYGQANPHFFSLRLLHLFMEDFGEVLAPMPPSFPAPQDLPRADDSGVRWAVRSDGEHAFVFVNNYERFARLTAKEGVQFEACGVRFPRRPLTIPAGCSAIFPVNVGGLRYATAQLVARRGGKVYLMEVPGIPATLALADGKVLHHVKPRGTARPVHDSIYLLTRHEAERLFLPAGEAEAAAELPVPGVSKVREAGPLRTIVKVRGKVAAAPAEADWQQAAAYRIRIPGQARALQRPLLAVSYRGDCARLYAVGGKDGPDARRLVADNFYYGRPFLFGLWRLPAEVEELELLVLPLQPDAPVYLPREADRTEGEALLKVCFTELQ